MNYLMSLDEEILLPRAGAEEVNNLIYVESTDRQLVELALSGDQIAFEYIFERYKRHLAILAGRFFGNPADVEEILQVTFAKAFFELKRFRGEFDFSLASWLSRIATNTCLNTLKMRQTKMAKLTTDFADYERNLLAANIKQKSAEELVIQRDLLEKLLMSLSVEDRMLLQLIYGQEMSVADVAESLGWSRAKVKVRAFRARRALNRIIKRLL